MKGWVEPSCWQNGMPGPEAAIRLATLPTPFGETLGEPDFPGHCGWYPVVICEIDPKSRFCQRTGIERVVPCGEQIVHRYYDGKDGEFVIAWPVAGNELVAKQTDEELARAEEIFDLGMQRAGPWRSHSFELEVGHESDEESEYSTARDTVRSDTKSEKLSVKSGAGSASQMA